MNYNLKGKGIFVFSDPAGANSVLALIDNFLAKGKQHGKDFLIFTNSVGIFSKSYENIVKRIEFNEGKAKRIIDDFKPDYIFSATSMNDFEHQWRKLAKNNNLKTIAFIDHWTSYYERFSFKGETVFTDEIWVINDVAKKEAIKAGIPEDLIIISGNPYYEKVKRFKPKIAKYNFFAKYKLNPTKKTILFISDDIKRSFQSDENGNCVLGFDEYTILRDILQGLKKLENKIDYQKYQLVLKLHPRDEVDKFKFITDSIIPQNLKIHILPKCNPLTINYYSDYVLGMFSNMVIEAILMNKKLLRTQINEKIDPLISFKISIDNTPKITLKDVLVDTIYKFLEL